MKSIALLIALGGPLQAGLFATFQTTRGNVVVEMQYSTAPKAVANFITLAEGTRPWVDSITGKIRRDPFYNDIKIHRTANDSGFKFAQGGSPKGDGSDGPGYTFKDEFSPTMTHVPYVFSMANAGPNSNGSQFFFTGSLSQPSFDNVHTILGLVTEAESRTVVDAMIAAGPNATTINGISFTRTDPAAVAFNEHAQQLPTVFQPAGQMVVSPGVSATWSFQSPIATGDVLGVFRSHTLAANDWAELSSAALHVGLDAPAATSAVLDNAAATMAFYHLTVASHPGSVAPSSLANRTVLLQLDTDLFQYEFNSTGSGGLATVTLETGIRFSFPFNTLDFRSSAHNVTIIVDNTDLAAPHRYFLIKIGCDTAGSSQIDGRHTIQLYNIFGWYPFESGLAAISR